MNILCGEFNDTKNLINTIDEFENGIKVNNTQYITNLSNNSRIQQLKGKFSNKLFPIITKKLISPVNNNFEFNEANDNNNSSILEIIDYPQSGYNLECEKHEKVDSGDTAKNVETLLINKYNSEIPNKLSSNKLNTDNIRKKGKSKLMSKFIQKQINQKYCRKNPKNVTNLKENKLNNIINNVNNNDETSNVTSSTIIMNSTIYFTTSSTYFNNKPENKQNENPHNEKNNNDELLLKCMIPKTNNNNIPKTNNPKKYHKNFAKNSTNFSINTNNDYSSQYTKKRINNNINKNDYSIDIDTSKDINFNLKPKDVSFECCSLFNKKPYMSKINSCLNIKNDKNILKIHPNFKSRLTTCIKCRKFRKIFNETKNVENPNQSFKVKNLSILDNNNNTIKITQIFKNKEFVKNDIQNLCLIKSNKNTSSDELYLGVEGKENSTNKTENKLTKSHRTIYNCKKLIKNSKKNKIPKTKSSNLKKINVISSNNNKKYLFDLFLNKRKKITDINMQNPFKQNKQNRKNTSFQNKLKKTFNHENKKIKPHIFYFHKNALTVPKTDILDSSTTDNNTISEIRNRKNHLLKSSTSFEKTNEVIKENNNNIFVHIDNNNTVKNRSNKNKSIKFFYMFNTIKRERNINKSKKGCSYSKNLTDLNTKESSNRVSDNNRKFTEYKKKKK